MINKQMINLLISHLPNNPRSMVKGSVIGKEIAELLALFSEDEDKIRCKRAIIQFVQMYEEPEEKKR